MEEVTITKADALMACSANIADVTARCYRLNREAIDVVHCGVDTESFRPVPDQRERRPTVLFVGNIVENKGVEVLLESVLRLRARYPDIRLLMVGKVEGAEGSLAGKLQERVESEGASANVEFAGFVGRDRLPEFYHEADVFCSPAQYEGGVANVYLEAMACGCPVVASTAGGGSEAVTDGKTGLLVPPNDIPAVAEALDRILGDPGLRRRMGDSGRRRAEEYFSMEQYIQRVLAVYRKAIERSRQELARLRASYE